MARTKNASGRKVPRTKNPSVSSSPPRSPSPPKPPTPKSSSPSSFEIVSESFKSLSEREASPEIQSTPSESPENSPIHLTQKQSQPSTPIESTSLSPNPTNNEDSPSPNATVPGPKDTPPSLVKIKKSKSFDSSKIRRSSRIMSGAEIDEFKLEPVTSTNSEPVKAKKTPTPRTKKKVNVKKSKEKLMPAPLIQPEDEEIFDKYWKTKPVALSRMYNFAELSLGGVDLVKFVEPFEWKSFFHIKETVYPLLVQAFYFNAKVYPEKDLLTSNIKDVELVVDPFVIGSLIRIKSEGLEVYGNDWYDQVKINKEDLKRKMFTEEGAKKNAPPSSMLKTEYKLLHNMCQHSFFPRTEAKTSLKNVSHMKKESETPVTDIGVKRKREVFEKTNLNVLADASRDRLENALQTDGNTQISGDVNPPLKARSLNILTSDTPKISTMPIPNPTDSTMPSIPSPFATFDSFCSSVNAVNAGTKQLVFEGNVNFDFPGPSRPAKRSRIETDMEHMRKDLDNVIKGMLHINPPPEIETPQFDPFPVQNDKSDDDDDCPATSPAPDGANE
ncbi:hypothetical protein TSUD_325660 [Trifolium subterraneum]|uniref:Uncharacterized protein n=1 Tax=Trifolium subterraneum TaxID=3900 RepID=A0A2Z6LLX5_TRISU|nr:hypothetical protein TSUD_325660 [Trifolium subterraneum]